MGSRFFISGVQLGILKVMVKDITTKKLLENIEKEQYLCEAEEFKDLKKTKKW